MKVEEILYHPAFRKDLRKLDATHVELAGQAEDLFRENPLHQALGLHQLGGKLRGAWAIIVSYKIRIIFVPWKPTGTVVFLSIGPHDLYDVIHRRFKNLKDVR